MSSRSMTFLIFAFFVVAIFVVAGPALGDAPFGLEIEILDQDAVNGVAVGDLDGMPGADVFACAESSDTLVFALQGAGGTWSETSLTPGSGSRGVELADLDGDGDLDLVYTDFGGGKLYWRSNDLDVSGTFLARQEVADAGGAQAVAIADIDGDGHGQGDLDLLLAGRIADAYYWIENVDGDASSWTRHLIQDGVNAAQAIWGGDFDGDGDFDVVGGSSSGSGKLAWYENTAGDGSAWTEHDIAAGNINAVIGADLDRDGDLDIIVQDSGVSQIRWWENALGEDPAWTVHSIATVSSIGRGLQAVDLDFDGDLDIVGSRDGDWYENNGDASGWTARALSAGMAGDLADTGTVDVDGDGDLDIVAARVDLDVVSWWPNLTCSFGDPDADGDGVFDGCDLCEGFDDNVDTDGDGIPDACDSCPIGDNSIDSDGDGIPDACDGVRILDMAVDEGDSGATGLTFTIVLGGATEAFSLGYSLTDGTATVYEDYSATSGTIDFAGDDGEVHAFTVFSFGDTMVEDDENFTVDLTVESGTVGLADPVGVGTLINDDSAIVTLDDVSLDEGDTGTTAFTFTLTLDADLQDGLEVDYATQAITATEGQDYVGHTGSIFFAGSAGEQQAVTVLVKGDGIGEDDEIFHLVLDPQHDAVAAGDPGVGTILDDDRIRVLVDDVSVVEGDSGSTELVFTLELNIDTDAFEVHYHTNGNSATSGEDYEGTNGTVSFNGTAGETQTVTVSVTGDPVVEGNETFSLELNPSEPGILVENATGTILDDDTATVAITDVALAEGDMGPTEFVFTVAITGAVQDAFDVSYQAIDGTALAGSDYTAVSGSVSLGDDKSLATLTVPVHGDTLGERDETFIVEIFATLPEGVTFTNTLGDGLIVDDDVVLTLAVEGAGHVGSSPSGIDCRDGVGNCQQLFTLDTVVDLTPTPEIGWAFVGWSGDADCGDGTVTMTSATACTAIFGLDQGTLQVSFQGSGFGLVTSDPEGIECDRDGHPSDCAATFDTGIEIALGVFITDPESSFGGFAGDPDCSDAVVTLGTPGATVHCIAILNTTPFFADGFESGGMSSWSSSVP